MNWMYLQPIFDSPDIAKQLPGETKKFKTVDQNWKHTMNYCKQTMLVIKVCYNFLKNNNIYVNHIGLHNGWIV